MSKIDSVSANISGITMNRAIPVKKEEVRAGDIVSIGSTGEKTSPSRAEVMEKALSKAAAVKSDDLKDSVKPFPDDQAQSAIDFFIENGMTNGTKAGVFKKFLFFHTRVKDSDEALSLLKKGKPVFIKNERNKYSPVDNLDNLQVLDSLKGRGENTILPDDQFSALRFLEKGPGEKDGLYNPGFFGKTRMNSYDAYYSLKRGEDIDINVDGKENLKARSPEDLAEANALYGEGKNTILPENQFDALKHFESGDDNNGGLFVSGDRVNAYDALQKLQKGEDVGVNTPQMKNLIARNPGDLPEADAFYGRGQNTVMPEKDFQLFKYFDKGKDGDDGFYVAGEKSNAYEALQRFQAGENAKVNIGDKTEMNVRDAADLAELDAFYGTETNTVMPDAHLDSMKYFDSTGAYRGNNFNQIDAYHALQVMQSGQPLAIENNGIKEKAYTPEDIHELDVLEGRGKNTILPQDQFDNLQAVKPYLFEKSGAGADKMSSYGALQKFQAGKPVVYAMTGGDFGENVSREAGNIDDLPDALTRLSNQQEYDKYRFSFPEYKDKTEKEMKKTPEILEADKKDARDGIDSSNREINHQEGKLSRAEHDLRNGKRDLDDAESDLSHARMMDDYKYEYGYHYGYNHQTGKHEYFYGRHRVENDEKQRKIRQAESDIDDAERKIRRAKDEISRAKRALEKAREQLQASELQLQMGGEIGLILPDLQSLMEGLNEGNFESEKSNLQAIFTQLNELAGPCGAKLQKNLTRQAKLLIVMDERPERPEGWTPPEPRME